MKSGRLEAFVDAVVAIIITVLMLELPRPKGYTFSAVYDLRLNYFAYLVSFLIMAVFWVNHHKIYQRIEKIDDNNLWINIGMLFVLSFAPYLTEWMEEYPNKILPSFCYWAFFLIIDIFFYFMMKNLLKNNPNNISIRDTVYSKRMVFSILGILMISLILGLEFKPVAILIGCFVTALIWIYGVSKI
jgi:uncharacterized membrane protein